MHCFDMHEYYHWGPRKSGLYMRSKSGNDLIRTTVETYDDRVLKFPDGKNLLVVPGKVNSSRPDSLPSYAFVYVPGFLQEHRTRKLPDGTAVSVFSPVSMESRSEIEKLLHENGLPELVSFFDDPYPYTASGTVKVPHPNRA